MKWQFLNRTFCVRRSVAFILSCAIVALMLIAHPGHAQQSGDSRPRRTDQNQKPTASPLPAQPRANASPTPKTPPRRPGVFVPELGEPPPPPALRAKPSPTPDNGEEVNPEDVIKFNTQLVTLNVRVIDRNNRPIDNVRQDEFKVYEDGALQPIFSFTKEEVPISYGLAVDTSGSLRTQLPTVIDAAKTIINSNKPGDETFLVGFISSDKIDTLKEFTSDKNALLDEVDNLFTEGGQTAVIDAVYLSAEHVAEYKKGNLDDRRRRALIVVTDGEDRNSYFKQDQLFERLREEDVQIYVIGFVGELDKEGGLIKKSSRERAVALLNRLATDTGGRAFYPQSITELPEIASSIVRDLRTQYVISYTPTNTAHDGTYRAIKVAVADASGKDKRIALTRAGYTAPRPGAPGVKPVVPRTNTPVRQVPPAAGARKSP